MGAEVHLPTALVGCASCHTLWYELQAAERRIKELEEQVRNLRRELEGDE